MTTVATPKPDRVVDAKTFGGHPKSIRAYLRCPRCKRSLSLPPSGPVKCHFCGREVVR